jgi:hypothetical protein
LTLRGGDRRIHGLQCSTILAEDDCDRPSNQPRNVCAHIPNTYGRCRGLSSLRGGPMRTVRIIGMISGARRKRGCWKNHLPSWNCSRWRASLLMALSRHAGLPPPSPLSVVKRTPRFARAAAANDPKRTTLDELCLWIFAVAEPQYAAPFADLTMQRRYLLGQLVLGKWFG